MKTYRFDRKFFVVTVCFLILAGTFGESFGQEKQVRWQRKTPLVKPPLQLFHSAHAVNLPTAETLQQGDFEFEISHRFLPLINDGYDVFWGLDGPVNMRLALGYALTNEIVFTLGRSNTDGNVDFQMKYRFIENRQTIPFLVALQAGVGWNTVVYSRSRTDQKNFQYYAQFILNTMWKKKLALGIVPSYLNNSDIFSQNVKTSFTLGSYLQLYVSNLWSVLLEWNPTLSGYNRGYNAVSFGIELETGGHFFKIFLTNSGLINPSQFLAGADLNPGDGEWRLAFMITRLLKFKK